MEIDMSILSPPLQALSLLSLSSGPILAAEAARAFIALLETLSPDPSALDFTRDLKWVATFLLYGTQAFEKRQAFDQMNYSQKIREMLDTHLEATGLSVTVKLRHITDTDFWEDFDMDGKLGLQAVDMPVSRGRPPISSAAAATGPEAGGRTPSRASGAGALLPRQISRPSAFSQIEPDGRPWRRR